MAQLNCESSGFLSSVECQGSNFDGERVEI